MTYDTNPFPETDSDRHAIWQMIVHRDIDAFLAKDWSMVAEDFIEEGFIGIDGRYMANPDSWRLTFPDLAAYRSAWLEQANAFADEHFADDVRKALFDATTLRDIEINGDTALLHKKFDGGIKRTAGPPMILRWQTLYQCRKVNGRWKLAGFVGYMPNPLGWADLPTAVAVASTAPAKRLPPDAGQHVTAGPYSPVLEVDAGQLVVISGQAAIDQQGQVVGDTIEEQARVTLENCFKQLATAGCSPADVFKVNVYMRDLGEWSRFNAVYEQMMPEPRPVRTAVESGLLMTLKVEVEMWGVKP